MSQPQAYEIRQTLILQQWRSNIQLMIEDRNDIDEEPSLKQLEVRLEELVRACVRLKDENRSLRSQQESLVAERAALMEKTEEARSRVEAMILRLKAMEQDT